MKRFIAYTLCGAALMLQLCSSGDDLAGGSGAGNPGGATAVAILADTTLDSTAGLPKAPRSSADTSRALALSDDNSLVLTVTSALIPVYKIYFLLDESIDCEALVDSFDSNLLCDSNGIVLDGPFVFDAITGEADPVFDTLKLPVAEYRGIKIIIGCESGADATLCSLIELTGTFDYEAAEHSFDFTIQFSTMLLYKYIGPPTLIDPNDTTLFQITLNAVNWLSGIDFGARLADNTIVLDSITGNLGLDAATAAGAQKAITSAIRDNIAESFKTAQIEIRASR